MRVDSIEIGIEKTPELERFMNLLEENNSYLKTERIFLRVFFVVTILMDLVIATRFLK